MNTDELIRRAKSADQHLWSMAVSPGCDPAKRQELYDEANAIRTLIEMAQRYEALRAQAEAVCGKNEVFTIQITPWLDGVEYEGTAGDVAMMGGCPGDALDNVADQLIEKGRGK